MTTLKFPTLVTDSLAKQIAESIREAIMDGRLKVDERLPSEEELAKRFGVSRPTIREALKRLAAQKLIHSRRGPAGGSFVIRPNLEEISETLASYTTLLGSLGEFSLDEIAEARQEMEMVCCTLAAQNRDASHLKAMQAELETQADTKISDQDFCASDVRFHRALVNATGNKLLQFVMYAIIEALQPAANMVTYRFRERKTVQRLHSEILSGIADRNPARAHEALRELTVYLKEKYEEALDWRQKHS